MNVTVLPPVSGVTRRCCRRLVPPAVRVAGESGLFCMTRRLPLGCCVRGRVQAFVQEGKQSGARPWGPAEMPVNHSLQTALLQLRPGREGSEPLAEPGRRGAKWAQ